MHTKRAIGALATVLVVATTSCGSDDANTANAQPDSDGTVVVTMTENAFSPDSITVDSGQEVTFRFRNEGKLRHEAFVGTADEQAAHEAEMTGDAGGEHGGGNEHGDGGAEALTVEPGDTGELTHRFEDTGELVIGCHEPGHWDAGMKMTVTVS